MFCKKCKKEISDDSKFCNFCGAKQIREKSNRRRGNGQGTVYRGTDGRWIAEVTIGWDNADGKALRKTKRKKGFDTKTEARIFCNRYFVYHALLSIILIRLGFGGRYRLISFDEITDPCENEF